ncbi:hypothetical protein MUCCIDRAFT_82041 [Mucor lusitanicus CBS 277.49]|uniref:Uncharacterized protein n=1 Tax=Mucor lusitanicus CBS 277.49 TaxID=747725 RepID=A0A168LXU2_MUCCL|nr:hypothetical protein MUCCIDRAFT_82041 [Mucor lusitanicus CBS 277.49]
MSKPDWNVKCKANEATKSPVPSVVSVTTSSTAATHATNSSASTAVSSISMRLHKLTDADKQKINAMYAGLNRNKLWKLKTGTIVEDKMKQFALSLEYEHILKLDLGWSDPGYRIPAYNKVENDCFRDESDCKWIQKSYRDTLRLLKSDFFPLHNQTEADLIKTVWCCLDSCLDFGNVQCIRFTSSFPESFDHSNSGEKCSGASAEASIRLAMNKKNSYIAEQVDQRLRVRLDTRDFQKVAPFFQQLLHYRYEVFKAINKIKEDIRNNDDRRTSFEIVLGPKKKKEKASYID